VHHGVVLAGEPPGELAAVSVHDDRADRVGGLRGRAPPGELDGQPHPPLVRRVAHDDPPLHSVSNIFAGFEWGRHPDDSFLPAEESNDGEPLAAVSVKSLPRGDYNAACDIWFNKTDPSNPWLLDGNNGAEVMIAAASGGPTAFDRFRRVMATIAAAIDLLVTAIKAAVIARAL
jgi:hypothetical protein